MPVEEVLEKPENIKSSLRIPGTMEVHKIARTFSRDGICKMEFCYTAVDEKPFHEQWIPRCLWSHRTSTIVQP